MGATYFFRDIQTLKMIACVLIPLILEDEDYKDKRSINIWSAGCANGAEPYTLAILLKEILDEEIFSRIQIYATDIDPNNRFENIIKKGSYPGRVRELLKTVCKIISLHFPQIWGMHSLFRN